MQISDLVFKIDDTSFQPLYEGKIQISLELIQDAPASILGDEVYTIIGKELVNQIKEQRPLPQGPYNAI